MADAHWPGPEANLSEHLTVLSKPTLGFTPKVALLVNADGILTEFLRQALKPAGIASSTLTSLENAPNHLGTGKFDIVFVDLGESPSNGIELTRRIRASGPHRATPIILLSDQQTKGILPRAFEAGATLFVSLPMETERLTRMIVNVTAIDQKVRRFRRIAKRLKVHLVSSHLQLEGETIDISLGGMLVRVPRTFPLGALVEISLHISDASKPVVGLGSVTRSSQSEIGVQIDRLTIEQSRRLQDFLLRLYVA
jgi:two-component system chemotaxis response regulator CheY